MPQFSSDNIQKLDQRISINAPVTGGALHTGFSAQGRIGRRCLQRPTHLAQPELGRDETSRRVAEGVAKDLWRTACHGPKTSAKNKRTRLNSELRDAFQVCETPNDRARCRLGSCKPCPHGGMERCGGQGCILERLCAVLRCCCACAREWHMAAVARYAVT